MLLSVSVLSANELESKCNKGDLEACAVLGLEYYDNENYAKAKDLWIKSCDGGNTNACYNLGLYIITDKV